MAIDTLERVLSGLDAEQREAVEAPRGPVCILAGAGTGKTRAVTHRIAYQVLGGRVHPQHVLAVTFTTRAAGELRARLRGLGVEGVQARTFHSAALRQLQYFWPQISDGPRPSLVESKLATIRVAAGHCRLSVSPTEQRDLASEIEWAKAALVEPEDYVVRAKQAHRLPPLAHDVVAQVFRAYESVNSDRGQLDFEDLLLLMAAAIENDKRIAAEVHERYRHFTVDEYQDVSPLQQRLLDAWLADRDDLCVVGDPNQTIYSFTGASPSYLREFGKRFPGATLVRLVRDYRSTNQVVGLANRIITDSKLQAQCGDGPDPTFDSYDDEPAEGSGVAGKIATLRKQGVPLADMAILFRVNAQSEVYEQALTAAGIPYVLRGGQRFFERPEVREAVVLLRGAARSEADHDTEGLVGTVTDVLSAAGFKAEPPAAAGAARDRWESLRALVGLAEEFAATLPGAGLGEFVGELAARADAQHAPPVEGVTLASLHSAKGLEWEAVFLVGLVDGTLPITHATTPAQVEEERRLLYVGVTRARRHLGLSWALARAAGGRRSRKPSEFLNGIRPVTLTGDRSPPRPKKALSDDPVVQRLRAWRLAKATEDGVPAYVVFDNKTLEEIASRAPTDRGELAAVPGIGPKKLDQYAEELLAVLHG
ncbi:MAG: ATP-dependent DNA helicase UvrD2 [Frankiaceae bacterium]|nr:ATP-dependent DNA helicase UvrD2 [Frankiaceae bacterium]MBV9872897.1 ATP-dependent DNA helicase UvrD2 [Frankiaceae bacterium]